MITDAINKVYVKPVCLKNNACSKRLANDTVTFKAGSDNLSELKAERDKLILSLRAMETLTERDYATLNQIKSLHISFLPRDAMILACGEYHCPNNAAIVIVDKIVNTLTKKDKLHQKAMQSFLDYYKRTKKHQWLFNLTSKICSTLEISNDKTLALQAAEKLSYCDQPQIKKLLQLELQINRDKILKNTNFKAYKAMLENIIKQAGQ